MSWERTAECLTLKQTIKEAMAELEQMPCGGVGADGPTLKKLNDYEMKNGMPFADDASYSVAQRAWRILEEALKG